MATQYKTDGTHARVAPANGTDFTLEELRQYTGADCIEIVRLHNGQLLVINDNGLNLNLPANHAASRICGVYIAGDAVLCSRSEVR